MQLFADGSSIMHWPPDGLAGALIGSTLFGVVGIALAIIGFKVFDKLTPGNLQQEIFQKGNIAAAVLAGAFIVGICIVISATVG